MTPRFGPRPFSAVLAPVALASALVAGLGSTPAGVSQEDPPADGARAQEVRSLVAELQAARAQRRALAASVADERAALGAEILRLDDDLQLARARSAAAASRAGTARAQVELARSLKTEVDAALEAVAGDAAALARATVERIGKGLPFQREVRATRAETLAADLEGEDREARSRATVDLMLFLGEELRLAETIEDANRRIELPDGRQVHAYVLRCGLLQEVFVSEDGADVGYAAGGWQLAEAAEARAQLEALVEAARGRRAAGLYGLPLPVAGAGGSR